MKTFKISLCFLIIFALCGCSKSEFMDLSGFIYEYNRISDTAVDFGDFFMADTDTDTCTALILRQGHEMLLSLVHCPEGKISKVRLTHLKKDNSGDISEVFHRQCCILIESYCGYTKEKSKDIVNAFSLQNKDTLRKTGEISLQKDNYYFLYAASSLSGSFYIYNTLLQEIPVTEKPVSKPYFGEDIVVIPEVTS